MSLEGPLHLTADHVDQFNLCRAIHLGEAPFPVYKFGTFRVPTVALQRLLNGETPRQASCR